MTNMLARKLEAFEALSLGDKSLLDEITKKKLRFKAGDVVVAEGAKPRDVNVVMSGTACRFKDLENGKRQIVGFLLPGDLCDLHVHILSEMDHSIGAITDLEIARIEERDIQRMLRQPALSRTLLMSTLVEEAILREWVANIGQRPARIRIAHLFCELYLRLSTVGLTEDGSFKLGISQVDLGDTVGLSTVHVNRSLASLKEEGVIAYSYKLITIVDFEKLARISGFQSNYLHLQRLKPK